MTLGTPAGAQEGTPQCTHIKASGHPDYPPFSWREGDQIVGTSATLVREAAKDLGVDISITYGGHWKRVMNRLTKGEIDLVVALYKDDARERNLLFGSPIVHDPVALFTPTGKPIAFGDWQDLENKRGAVVLGEVFGPKLDAKIKTLTRLRYAENINSLLRLLDLGRVDYVIHGEYPVLAAIHKHRDAPTIERTAILGAEKSYFAMAPGSACRHLIGPLSEKIAELKGATFAEKVRADFDRWTRTPSSAQAAP
ncbi:MAG: transporter substrate-binding domain-containing protein [Alphaproteobacteria bacterium]|nr:transporter substrate-binding domain-containing protein [Alphaproteobacteria bacterium]